MLAHRGRLRPRVFLQICTLVPITQYIPTPA